MQIWVVQLEAASTEHTGPIDKESVARLLEVLGAHPVGLYTPGRCLVQLRIDSSNQAEAVAAALSRWEEALPALGCPRWPIVRTEVFTLEELQREFEDDDFRATLGVIRVAPDEGDDADDLIRAAFSDLLTNLANSEVLEAHLHAALARARRLGTTPAVLLIDLDAFHAVNDRFGASAGDDLLVTVARRLQSNVRASDTLARVGGDQFGVLTQDSSPGNAVMLCQRLLGAVHDATLLDGEVVIPVARAGIALSEPADTAATLYEKACAALASAKRSRDARYKLWAAPTSPPGAVGWPPRSDAV